jgi:integrase
MTAQPPQRGTFETVGECLQRYTSTGTYYARVRHRGKLILKSLKTSDRALAKRKLADFRRDLEKIDPRAGKVTVAELADRYRDSQRHLAKNTQAKKDTITTRIKKEWPGGSDVQVREVRESDVRIWLARQRGIPDDKGEADGANTSKPRMGKASYNDYVEYVRDMFRLAVSDKMIVESPAAHIKQLKRDKPIRAVPTCDQFQAIVESIRQQRLHAECEDSADFVEFVGTAGLGNAEAANLRWGDIDWAKDKIRVYRHKTDVGFVIPIFPTLRPLLERLRGDGGQPHDARVFKIQSAKKSLAAACKRRVSALHAPGVPPDVHY